VIQLDLFPKKAFKVGDAVHDKLTNKNGSVDEWLNSHYLIILLGTDEDGCTCKQLVHQKDLEHR